MVSRTAQYVALYRALEASEPARPPLFVDPLARRFLRRRLRVVLGLTRSRIARAALVRYADARAPGARTSAIARTALLDDELRRAAGAGVRQVIVLGAGFDCRAHRMPELAGARIFEVDRADTQAFKRARLGERGQVVRYVAVDFLRDDVARALVDAGWDAAAATFVLWEGVTNYLREDAVAHVLAWAATMAPGSAIAFTYVHRGVIDGSVDFVGGTRIVDNVRALGEPWTFGITPDGIAPFVERCGLALRSDAGADDYRLRYLGHADPGYAFYRVAIAEPRPK